MGGLPQVRPLRVVRALKKRGFIERNRVGSHVTLVHPATKHRTGVPMHPGDVPRGLLRQIIKQAGLTEEEFRQLL